MGEVAPDEIEPFGQRVARLAKDRGLSVAQVRYLAYEGKGTSPETAKKVLEGSRPVTTVLVEAIARVLEVPPEEFPEYRLAVARRELDEREVGLDQALMTLEGIEQALRPRRVSAERLAAERKAATGRRLPRDRPAAPKSRGG